MKKKRADHTEDQIDAAVADARHTMATFLGLPDTHRPRTGTAPILDEMLDRHLTPGAARCSCLAVRPVQPWYLTLPFNTWRCQTCTRRFAHSWPRPHADFVEEHTLRSLPPVRAPGEAAARGAAARHVDLDRELLLPVLG